MAVPARAPSPPPARRRIGWKSSVVCWMASPWVRLLPWWFATRISGLGNHRPGGWRRRCPPVAASPAQHPRGGLGGPCNGEHHPGGRHRGALSGVGSGRGHDQQDQGLGQEGDSLGGKDLRQDMKDLRQEMNARFDKQDAKLDRLVEAMITDKIKVTTP